MSAENIILAVVREYLGEVAFAESTALDARLAAMGITLQPFDLDLVLSRHPELFGKNYKGQWSLVSSMTCQNN